MTASRVIHLTNAKSPLAAVQLSHALQVFSCQKPPRYLSPPSHTTVATTFPSPSSRAALTAPTTFSAALGPTNRP